MQPHRQINIGVVEDDQIMGSSLIQRFELDGHKVDWWKTGSDAVNSLEFFEKDIIICDIRLPDITGETVLRQASRDGMAPPFLFITAYGEIDQAVRLMRLGACDYVTKPFEFDEFLGKVERNARGPYALKGKSFTLGYSAEMRRLQDSLKKFSATEFPVLISGEIGVGKELAAQFCHVHSRASGHPFISINCAAIPDDLLEKEIFGSEPDTHAHGAEPHKGYAERVGAGTLYFKDISRTPASVQARLIELLDDNTFKRANGTQTLEFHGRLVMSDSCDLAAAVSQGLFREDLLFKLSVLTASISPLRDRPDDIDWLLPQMIDDACTRQGQLMKTLSSHAAEAALDYNWPGNSLEMRNRVERAVALSRDEELRVADLFPERAESGTSVPEFPSLAQAREDAERRQIIRALDRADGRIGDAARLLSVSRTTLWEKMSRLNLDAKGCSES